MLFNKDGELLFSYQKEELNRLPEQYRSSGIYEIWENGRALTLLVHESEWNQAFVFPSGTAILSSSGSNSISRGV